jgi:hypothetical protein
MKTKEEVRKSTRGLAQTLPLNVCDAPKAHSGRWQTADFGVCAKPLHVSG